MNWRKHRPSRRGVSSIFATIFLVGITVVSAAVLYAFRPPLPPTPVTLTWYVTTQGSIQAWGDGSDCTMMGTTQTCLTLPGIEFIFPSPPTVDPSAFTMVFYCNGSVYLEATLAQMEWVPGQGGTVGGTGPQLQHCGTYTPPKAAWNRFAYFQQVIPGATVMHPGDTLVVYAQTFTTFKDDDFHGAPAWCYTVVGACILDIIYTASATESVAASIPLLGYGGA